MEFCFLCSYGQTSTDWAAWTQAIGSVLAIIAAILIALYQGRQVRKLSVERDRLRFGAQTQVAHYFAMRINLIFDEAYKAGQIQDIFKMRLLSKKLDDILKWSRTFPFDTLNYDKMNSFIRIRDKAFELMLFSNDCGFNEDSAAIQVKSYFEEIAGDIFWQGINIPDWSEYNPLMVDQAD
jgi:hypothetical protein